MDNFKTTTIVEKSSAGYREVRLESRHLANRKVFIYGEINADMADDFLSKFLYLEESKEPVTIYINSPGGEINAGLLIYDIIQNSKLPINMVCSGMAASMAAIIFAGGQKGRRYILSHSKVMIHEPLLSGGLGGSATSIKNISDSILQTKDTINGILAKHTGKSPEEIDKATPFHNYMNAEEAIRFGICDQITRKLNV